MSKINPKEIGHLAHLARLALNPDEKKRFSNQLTSILDHVDELNKVNTASVEQISQITDLKNVLRQDEDKIASETLTRAEALKNAADQKDGFFKIRSIF